MLGFIVAPLGTKVEGQYPTGIQYSYGGSGTYLCPPDPQYYHRGEAGLYYDTSLGGLGAIPTDAELARNYGYTPVTSGWVNAKEGYFPSPWVPPGGWNAAGAFGPQPSLSGLGGSAGLLSGYLVFVGAAVAGFFGYRALMK